MDNVQESTKPADPKWKPPADQKPPVAVTPVDPAKPVRLKVATFDNIDVDNDKFMYPFFGTKPGQGFFVANAPNETTAQTLAKLHSHVAYANDWYSEIELDKDGDEVWEEVFVKSTKRNPDGSVQRDSNGRIIYGHNPVSRPNYIYSRRYVARVIAKDDLIAGKKSEADGVLVVRVV